MMYQFKPSTPRKTRNTPSCTSMYPSSMTISKSKDYAKICEYSLLFDYIFSATDGFVHNTAIKKVKLVRLFILSFVLQNKHG